MREEILNNLETTAAAAAFFIGFWLVNTIFGIWRNVGLRREGFDPAKVRRGVGQAGVLTCGLSLFSALITTYPYFLARCGVAVPDEYAECFSSAAILLLFIYPTLVYMKDAYAKLKEILGVGKEEKSALGDGKQERA